ncbi:adenylate/guanylate cyclase domain-containing protein [Bradyrhizobium sp. SSUT18]|uniref:adenylate/guanylate cyclase domain-containing protein n=1 Tax=Bradyrhizobium sp. SSUT18 TaxID=3040602 RepID=UPI00244AFE74|nr:adenylate/guanylate cyclase domain-containing protein [Bradyrhizobium sp. SSUT18]MDH2404965.1 adenylate/guanylate cyclase domain-containing protein [Bradyrhizobium sp. SSUT18]
MGDTRKITAILAADIVGYSRLTGADEDRTLARLRTLQSDLVDPTIAVHNGRVVKRTGDGLLVEFRSVVNAVLCAIEIQNGMVERNAGLPPERRIDFRIGIHLGDVVEERDGDLMGDGVNIAARLEGIALPGGICLSEDAYRQVKARLDLAVSDLGATRLKNIIDPIRVYSLQVGLAAEPRLPPQSEPGPHQETSVSLSLPEKPSIAVLAFQNMSGDIDQEFFADGIAEDIITALSKARWLFVIARNSSFTYKGKSTDIRQVGRELGVRYVLEGSVRKAGNRVRITAQLIEANSGHHLWAERFDRALEDIFAVQDEITRNIIGAIAPGIVAAEIQRSQGKEVAKLGQWERVMRAHWHVQRFTPADCNEAIRLIDEVLQFDPANAMALADLAYNWHMGGLFGWTKGPFAVAVDRMGEAARRAVAADDRDAAAQTALAVHELFNDQHDDAIRRLHRAIELDPNSSFARGYLGAAYSFNGTPDLSLEALQESMRLSPRDYLTVIWHTCCAWSHLHAERFAEAVDCARQAVDFNPSFPDSHATLTAAAAHLGRMAEARTGLDGLMRLLPGLTLADPRLTRPFRRQTDRERFLEGLRIAGLPD